MIDTAQTAALAAEWELNNDFIHLNHAAVGPWPKRTKVAIQQFAAENAQQGSWNYLSWLKVESQLRRQLQTLINAPSWQDIALLKNTSEALSVIAYGLQWTKGDNVVISGEEFPSNHIVWESLKNKGVEVRYANLSSTTPPEQSLYDLCDKKTKLLAISSVQYASGRQVDLNSLGQFCNNNQILFCVDAIQSIGATTFDVQTCQADFVVADGHKWMLGPEGLALFYSTPEARDKLTLKQFGWHMVNNPSDFDKAEWEVATSARRFECGSPNMLGIHGLSASLSLLLELGMDKVALQVKKNADYLFKQLHSLPNIALITPEEENNRAGIINFYSTTVSSEKLFNTLTENNIFCAKRGKGLRLSPHYYTTKKHLDLALGYIDDI